MMSRLQKLQDEIIEVQIQIRDLEEQRSILRKELNTKLSSLLRDKRTLKKVRPIDSFSKRLIEMGSDVSKQTESKECENMANVTEVCPRYVKNGYAGENWNYLNSSNVVSENLSNTMLTIRNAEVKKLGQGEEARNKVVLSFNETSKQLALNSTNSKIIAERYGDDTDRWTSKQITLIVVKKSFAGKLVDGIQVVTL
jgi:hypothetical protein